MPNHVKYIHNNFTMFGARSWAKLCLSQPNVFLSGRWVLHLVAHYICLAKIFRICHLTCCDYLFIHWFSFLVSTIYGNRYWLFPREKLYIWHRIKALSVFKIIKEIYQVAILTVTIKKCQTISHANWSFWKIQYLSNDKIWNPPL